MSAPLGLLRRAALALGDRLFSRGQIHAVEDVFYLSPDEAAALFTDRTHGFDIVIQRKAERAWVLAHPGPASYGREPGPPPPLRGLPEEARFAKEAALWTINRIFAPDAHDNGEGRTLTGIPASPGRYTGPVRIIRSEAEFGWLQAGDVLVCPVTSPVWSVIFPSVGALVTDHGGTLSHPAIIAREYRVPAVVATRAATAQLRDGQVVVVDGTAGTVQVLS